MHYLCAVKQLKQEQMFAPTIYRKPKTLLSTQNAKTIKGEKLGYTTHILYMAPHKQNSKGKSICPKATEGCSASCLFTAGRGRFSNVKIGRWHKTEFFLRDRNGFMEALVKEVTTIVNKGGDKICIRLNGTSDIPYENIPVGDYPNIMSMFPTIQWYDYTKVFTRLKKQLPANYHLTFSRAETEENHIECGKALQLGFNVAAVFNLSSKRELPQFFDNYRVVNGDENDLTFIHPKGVIIGLKAKGEAKKDLTGFVIQDF